MGIFVLTFIRSIRLYAQNWNYIFEVWEGWWNSKRKSYSSCTLRNLRQNLCTSDFPSRQLAFFPQIFYQNKNVAAFTSLKLQLHDAIYRLRFYSNSLVHILSLSNSHNNVASIQKNQGDKSQHCRQPRFIVRFLILKPIGRNVFPCGFYRWYK